MENDYLTDETNWTLDAEFKTYWQDKNGNVYVMTNKGFEPIGITVREFIEQRKKVEWNT